MDQQGPKDEQDQQEGMRATVTGTESALAAEVRRFGEEPDFERFTYDPNNCSTCGQPVLIVQSKERAMGARSERVACEYCYSRLSKRTRAKTFKWIFLQGWEPEKK